MGCQERRSSTSSGLRGSALILVYCAFSAAVPFESCPHGLTLRRDAAWERWEFGQFLLARRKPEGSLGGSCGGGISNWIVSTIATICLSWFWTVFWRRLTLLARSSCMLRRDAALERISVDAWKRWEARKTAGQAPPYRLLRMPAVMIAPCSANAYGG